MDVNQAPDDGEIQMNPIVNDLESRANGILNEDTDITNDTDTSLGLGIDQEIEQQDIADNSEGLLPQLSFVHRLRSIKTKTQRMFSQSKSSKQSTCDVSTESMHDL